jgi:hypothetical protein
MAMRSKWEKNFTPYSDAEKKAFVEAKKNQELKDTLDWEAKTEGILPELQGSEKQIAWARSIRYKILHPIIAGNNLKPYIFRDSWESEMLNREGFSLEGKEKKIMVYIRENALPYIRENSAKWWIDHRDDNINHIMGPFLGYSDLPLSEEEKKEAARLEEIAKEESSAKSHAAFLEQQQGYLDSKMDAKRRYREKRAQKKAAEAAAQVESKPQEMKDTIMKVSVPVVKIPVAKRTPQQLSALRSEVCRSAWVLIRKGYSKSEAFKRSWSAAR